MQRTTPHAQLLPGMRVLPPATLPRCARRPALLDYEDPPTGAWAGGGGVGHRRSARLPLRDGNGAVLRDGGDVTVFAAGMMVQMALKQRGLQAEGCRVRCGHALHQATG